MFLENLTTRAFAVFTVILAFAALLIVWGSPAYAETLAPQAVAAAPVLAAVAPAASVAAVENADAAGKDIFAKTPCSRPKSVDHFRNTLPHTASLLNEGKPLTIVALGSSSTAGAGATSPAFHYPSRLADELRKKFPRSQITMINRGVNGEDTDRMMARLDAAVLQEKPDLVLWQFGVNGLLRDQNLDTNVAVAQQGVERIKASGSDVVLVDAQYVPRVLAKPDAKKLMTLMSDMAERAHVALFPRFEVMRHWYEDKALGFETFSIADGLHLNDWGYSCVAHVMGEMIEDTVTRARNIKERPLSATLHPM